MIFVDVSPIGGCHLYYVTVAVTDADNIVDVSVVFGFWIFLLLLLM